MKKVAKGKNTKRLKRGSIRVVRRAYIDPFIEKAKKMDTATLIQIVNLVLNSNLSTQMIFKKGELSNESIAAGLKEGSPISISWGKNVNPNTGHPIDLPINNSRFKIATDILSLRGYTLKMIHDAKLYHEGKMSADEFLRNNKVNPRTKYPTMVQTKSQLDEFKRIVMNIPKDIVIKNYTHPITGKSIPPNIIEARKLPVQIPFSNTSSHVYFALIADLQKKVNNKTISYIDARLKRDNYLLGLAKRRPEYSAVAAYLVYNGCSKEEFNISTYCLPEDIVIMRKFFYGNGGKVQTKFLERIKNFVNTSNEIWDRDSWFVKGQPPKISVPCDKYKTDSIKELKELKKEQEDRQMLLRKWELQRLEEKYNNLKLYGRNTYKDFDDYVNHMDKKTTNLIKPISKKQEFELEKEVIGNPNTEEYFIGHGEERKKRKILPKRRIVKKKNQFIKSVKKCRCTL